MSTMHSRYTQPITEVIDELLELDVDPLGRRLEDAAAIRAGIPAWHPRNDEGDDGGDGTGDDAGAGADDEAGDGSSDDDDDEAGDGNDDDDDDDSPAARAARAEKAAAKANRELREHKRQATEAERKAAEKAGKFEDLYRETLKELEDLKAENETASKRTLAIDALSALGAKNPARAVKLMDLDDVEDEAAATRAARDLKRSDKYLFNDKPTRQKRSAGDNDDNDDEDDRKPSNGSRKTAAVGVDRIRQGYANSAKND